MSATNRHYSVEVSLMDNSIPCYNIFRRAETRNLKETKAVIVEEVVQIQNGNSNFHTPQENDPMYPDSYWTNQMLNEMSNLNVTESEPLGDLKSKWGPTSNRNNLSEHETIFEERS